MNLEYEAVANLQELTGNNQLIINLLYRFLFRKHLPAHKIDRPTKCPCHHQYDATVDDDTYPLIFESFAAVEEADIAHCHDNKQVEADHKSVKP